MDKFELPKIESLESYPPNNNPFHHDKFNMGVGVSGAWVAMTDQFSGHKHDYNCSPEEKEMKKRGEPVFYDDPKYLIFVNQKTGQRFKLLFPDIDDESKD